MASDCRILSLLSRTSELLFGIHCMGLWKGERKRKRLSWTGHRESVRYSNISSKTRSKMFISDPSLLNNVPRSLPLQRSDQNAIVHGLSNVPAPTTRLQTQSYYNPSKRRTLFYWIFIIHFRYTRSRLSSNMLDRHFFCQ